MPKMNIKNTPEDTDLVVLPEGVSKLVAVADTKLQNAASFTIALEDHTLGNLLWAQLLSDPTVLYAGYKLPHPLEQKIVVKVETNGESTPKRAMERAIACLLEEFSTIEERFKFEMPKFIADQQGQEDYF